MSSINKFVYVVIDGSPVKHNRLVADLLDKQRATDAQNTFDYTHCIHGMIYKSSVLQCDQN